MAKISLENGEIFHIQNPENYSGLYFPVANEKGLKSSVTPNFGGDAKWNQNAFLLEPVSEMNLHNNRGVRNVWVLVEGKGAWSAVGASAEEENKRFTEEQDESSLKAGYMWLTETRTSKKYALESEITLFSPLEYDVEVMKIVVKNTSTEAQTVTPIVAIPIYGRSADNIRDHRHVTAMLQRIQTTEHSVLVKPTLSFDERGHKKNDLTYFVSGVSGTGEMPESFYPLVDTWIGEGGTLIRPLSVVKNIAGVPAGSFAEGKEALGGIRFATTTLAPNEMKEYTILLGITREVAEIDSMLAAMSTEQAVDTMLHTLQEYWTKKVNITTKTGSDEMDCFMRWVGFQPFLRRIYGCSFLPHHDYGRGGRGWRDLWQDCLSLLIMDPKDVRNMILDNYGGVRMDGTNATIIGSTPGEFIADRNGIARVWMDHGVWPFITTKLYLDQTGDIAILNQTASYFKDEQCMRGTALDEEWTPAYGVKHQDTEGKVYEGTILEHILIENLCAFYEVGEHNHMKLRGADWNDALDMATKRGESVAFTAAYAGNLTQLAKLALELKQKGIDSAELLSELQTLILDDIDYDDIAAKKAVLEQYMTNCRHQVDATKVAVPMDVLAESLLKKANWIKEHIRKEEWIQGDGEGWFNSYYDNDGEKVEGYYDSGVRMMLTGQVFTIMSETATEDQVANICKSADAYLYRKEIGGYRLNTNFHEEKYNMGRMFGFAYGEKENGAVFSHMTVMYANALYQRGFVKEGYKALQTLADQALDFDHSKIYPGVPEYFDANGRGLYHYLTGAASWYLLTYVTEVFGVKGKEGNLTLTPKLMGEQFGDGVAKMEFPFAGRTFEVTYENAKNLPYGAYKIERAIVDGREAMSIDGASAMMSQELMKELTTEGIHKIHVVLG